MLPLHIRMIVNDAIYTARAAVGGSLLGSKLAARQGTLQLGEEGEGNEEGWVVYAEHQARRAPYLETIL